MTGEITFFDKLVDAIRYARNTDLVVIDGPESNFAVVEHDAAAPAPLNHYGFWSIGDAEAFDASRASDPVENFSYRGSRYHY